MSICSIVSYFLQASVRPCKQDTQPTYLPHGGTLSCALAVHFNLKKHKSRLQDAIRESNTMKNTCKLHYVIMCNGGVHLNTFAKELNTE